jgi:hypothetical protein
LLERVIDSVLGVASVGAGIDEGEFDVATVEAISGATTKSIFDPGKTTSYGTVHSGASTSELLASSDLEDGCSLTAPIDQLVYNDVSIKHG